MSILGLLVPLFFCLAQTNPDSDGDGLSDQLEQSLGTNPYVSDSDDDGYPDGKEVATGYNPLSKASSHESGDRDVEKKVEVNLNTQTLDYFLNNVKIGSIPVSTGLRKTPTPVGEFQVMKKVPTVRYRGIGYDFPNTKWNLMFKNGFYLHGAYWHNQFGKKPMSHGCVNIAYKNAEKLYQFLDVGNKVIVKGKTPAGVIKAAGL